MSLRHMPDRLSTSISGSMASNSAWVRASIARMPVLRSASRAWQL
jgi:hypothetical protein